MPNSHVSMEADQVSDSIFEDDTLPAVDDVQAEFGRKATDTAGAVEFLAELDIDAAAVTQAVGKIALINSTIAWSPAADRYQFTIGDGEPDTLAVPILEEGRFVDLLLVDHDISFGTVCGRAKWLGRDYLAPPVVRLHANPLDWLRAGCEGVCHIELCSRQGLKDLRPIPLIMCNDIATALEAAEWMACWGWYGNDADADLPGFDEVLQRFEIDATPEVIRGYFEEQARRRALRDVLAWERARRVPAQRTTA